MTNLSGLCLMMKTNPHCKSPPGLVQMPVAFIEEA
jgi:hypothetical protein